MQKVLFLTTNDLFPINSGSLIYSTSIIKYLRSKDTYVTLVNFCKSPQSKSKIVNNQLQYYNERHEIVLNSKNYLTNLSFKYPYTIKKYYRKEMVQKLHSLLKGNNYDAIIFDHLHMATYIDEVECSNKILIQHNVESNIWKEYMLSKNGLIRHLVKFQYSRMIEFEKKSISKFKYVFTISDEDKRDLILLNCKANVNVLHPIIEISRSKTDEEIQILDNSILFVGDMSWFPNHEAALFLINKLMPVLREQSDITLYIVGKNPGAELIELSKQYKDIIVTGKVDSIDPYYRRCDIFINSVTSGSGLNIKLVEAMAKGIPVISSEFGSRGLNIIDKMPIVLYKNVNELKNQILHLMDSPIERTNLVSRALSFCYSFFKPNKLFDDIFNI
ncbi:MAG: glycosyltransferase family 4 protein [Candidatus Paracaedibacteraceae bacterium]|nr:glycosyltransferase family 4 protein [Candidatus Paracaedibacteraceae bacterium]